MYYSGIDLHKDMSVITTINENGVILSQSKVPNHEAPIITYFNQVSPLGAEHKAVVESTANWYWLSDLLIGQGIDLTLAHAKYLKAISYAKVKTDKVDSHTLATLLRLDMVPEAHQISQNLRPIRDLMRARLSLVVKKTSCRNSMHRLLAKYNLNLPRYPKPNDFLKLKSQLLPEPRLQLSILEEQLNLIVRQIKTLEQNIQPKLIGLRSLLREDFAPRLRSV